MQSASESSDGLKLYLLQSCYDEGVEHCSTRVYQAPSAEAVARHILQELRQPQRRDSVHDLFRSINCRATRHLADPCPALAQLTPQELLQVMHQSYVDGDSSSKVSLIEISPHEIVQIPQ
eukprot:TRINITY_DN3517_c0_g1_i3.p1 TRINITY_DN3517_c0_g1~~TRINITY_DN3517_c0_g1_i3.p1  ORF type:complete len:120 (+),score=12.91 TRINITY_DN3517_c0_g1_i3:106-465(+)